jgi:signal transduction histidine kinase
MVRADVTRLVQVFANLLNNAAKYSDPGARIALATAFQTVASSCT